MDTVAVGAPELKALLLTDLVGSTQLVESVGDAEAARLGALHDAAARSLLAGFTAREIDKTDGFLFLFDRAADALRFALAYHAALRGLSADSGRRLEARVGIHLGEVYLRANPPADVARGAKPFEVEGLAKPLAARVMSLAEGGQTLLTRGAFDMCRRAVVGDASFPPGLQWVAHGPYLLKGVEEPVDIFEAGEAGVSPLRPPADSTKARRALRPGEEELLGWRPAPGGQVPGRPGWALDRKLGEGGYGEVWLAHFAKTRDQRVFKFCFDPDRVRGLKREVTLFRVLREVLGDRKDIARILEWNFERPPYFIESEFTPGGCLVDWAAGRGGLAGIALDRRIEFAAEVAEALAAAHSVGVLHKDIKPSNLLVAEDSAGEPHARLADFGIGLVTDRAVLAVAGVTGTGLSEASLTANDSSRTGTRLYMAPELLEGRPATIQSDLYALGVVLYQLAAGRLGHALAAGWEADIGDALLREDIAACVAGDPARRLSSAGELAARLRGRPARRRARLRRSAARGVAAAAVLLAAIASGALWTAHAQSLRATREAALRLEAEQARRAAEQQSALVLERLKGTSALVGFTLSDLREVLDLEREHDKRIAKTVAKGVGDYYRGVPADGLDERSRLEHAAQLESVSRAFLELGVLEDAEHLASESLRLRRALLAPDHPDALRSRAALASVLRTRARHQDALELCGASLALIAAKPGGEPSAEFELLCAQASVLEDIREYGKAEVIFERAVSLEGGPGPLERADALQSLGVLRMWMNKFDEGEADLLEALRLTEAHAPHDELALAARRNALGLLYYYMGRLDAARAHLEEAIAVRTRRLGAEHASTLSSKNTLGCVLGRDPADKARCEEIYREVLAGFEAVYGRDHPNYGLMHNNLGTFYAKEGRLDEAEHHHREALAARIRAYGAQHATIGESRWHPYNIHLRRGDRAAVRALFDEAVATTARVTGGESLETCNELLESASRFLSADMLDDAERVSMRATELAVSRYPEAQPWAFSSGSHIQSARGCHEDAERLILAAIDAHLRHPKGGSLPDLYRSLALVKEAQGDFAAADAAFEFALAHNQASLNFEPRISVLHIERYLAEFKARRGDFEAAHWLLGHALAECRRQIGPSNVTTREMIEALLLVGEQQAAAASTPEAAGEAWREVLLTLGEIDMSWLTAAGRERYGKAQASTAPQPAAGIADSSG
ncbi:MAG: tetratricopeptide repeat protein [Candidatus Sumerlaeia bacterium]|nr:tetratricopeptide repeat protein [Candidatus Sumerlaeia bacterium]